MQRVGLHGLRQAFDAQGRLPGRVAQPEGRLDAGDFAREEGGGDLRQALRALRRQAKARIRRHGDDGRARIWLWRLPCAAASTCASPSGWLRSRRSWTNCRPDTGWP